MQKPSFQNPPSLYRPHSFWSLNERLNPQTLCEQIDDMHSAGWGGFYFHSRGGLITPYMGEEWMACFDAAMKHAKALGMKAWLYDEDTWPSGTASCTIPKLDPAFRETHIFYAYDKIPHQKEDVLASYVYRAKCEPTGNHRMYGLEEHLPPVDLVPITPDEAENCPEGYRNVYIYIWRAPASNSRFGGCSYTDLMNPDATRAFIRSTHEKYAARFAEEFGGVIPGIFTDDITIQWDLYGAKRNAMPWTGKLPEAFLALNGYDILEHLPDLFFDTPEASATRMDYIRVINRLFAENFVGVIAEWCGEHNLALTGHLMGNEGGYSDVMYQYYLMQIPATDHLGKNIRNFRRPRRALSVADQFDKPYTICETSAGGGHDMTMEEQKRLTDFLLVAGARVMVPHVTQYSMRGSRKYDHPPAFSARDPYWSEMHWLGDYQGRLAYALSQGKMDAHVLLLDNIESKHISCAPAGRSRQYDALNNALDQVERELLSAHCEFAYGSEELLSRFGRVENGELCLGSGRYSAVIIPPALTLRSSTLSLLKELKAQGGEVVAMLRAPALCDGRKNNPYLPFLATVPLLHYHQIKDFAAPYALDISDEYGSPLTAVHTTLRRDGDTTLCFMANYESEKVQQGYLTLPYPAKVECLDLLTGECAPAVSTVANGKTTIPVTLHPCGSLLLSFTPSAQATSHSQPKKVKVETTPLASTFDLALDMPNMLYLDQFIQHVHGEGDSPKNYIAAFKRVGDFTMKTTFYSEDWDGHDGYLLLECSENWEVTLNGAPLTHDGECMISSELHTLKLDGLVKAGENHLDLHCKVGYSPEMQPVYIAGPFSVMQKGNDFIIKDGTPATVCRDLTREGFPFYAGNATLSTHVEFSPKAGQSYRLSLGGLHAILATVKVNGKAVMPIISAPYETDITDALVEGDNVVEITLCGWLRNFYGPHHVSTPAKNTGFLSPAHYLGVSEYSDAYHCVPFGLNGAMIFTYEELRVR